MRHRRLVVDGLDFVIRVTTNSMLVLRGDEVIGQLSNAYGNRFRAIPSPQKGTGWRICPTRDDAIRYLAAIFFAGKTSPVSGDVTPAGPQTENELK